MRHVAFATMDIGAIPALLDRLGDDWRVLEYWGQAIHDQDREIGDVSSFAGLGHFLATNSGADLVVRGEQPPFIVRNFAPGIAIFSSPEGLWADADEIAAARQWLSATWPTLTEEERCQVRDGIIHELGETVFDDLITGTR